MKLGPRCRVPTQDAGSVAPLYNCANTLGKASLGFPDRLIIEIFFLKGKGTGTPRYKSFDSEGCEFITPFGVKRVGDLVTVFFAFRSFCQLVFRR